MNINANDLGYSFFESGLRMIHEVTKALNALGKTGALDGEDFHITVSLRDSDGNRVGMWLDEVDAKDWEFSTVKPGSSLSKP